jgi:hypothetical protein
MKKNRPNQAALKENFAWNDNYKLDKDCVVTFDLVLFLFFYSLYIWFDKIFSFFYFLRIVFG